MDNYHSRFDDPYFSDESGLNESRYVFIDGNQIQFKEHLSVGELGFGSGLNFLALLDYLYTTLNKKTGNPEISLKEPFSSNKCELDFYSCEKYPLTPSEIQSLLEPYRSDLSFFNSFIDQYCSHSYWDEAGFKSLNNAPCNSLMNLKLIRGRLSVNLHLFIGDVKFMLNHQPMLCDHWFLDGHDPQKNPSMWSPDTMEGVAAHSKIGTTFATYTAAGSVKQALRQAGFFVKRKKGFGKKRHMIYGHYMDKGDNFA